MKTILTSKAQGSPSGSRKPPLIDCAHRAAGFQKKLDCRNSGFIAPLNCPLVFESLKAFGPKSWMCMLRQWSSVVETKVELSGQGTKPTVVPHSPGFPKVSQVSKAGTPATTLDSRTLPSCLGLEQKNPPPFSASPLLQVGSSFPECHKSADEPASSCCDLLSSSRPQP